jgi:CRP/FNR family cyclic AMP-dependent transcriptional regulator
MQEGALNQGLLSGVELFDELSETELSVLAQGASRHHYPKGAVLISEGDHTDTLFVVLSGKLRVYASGEEGREVTLNTLGPGDHFGELAVMDESPRSASVVTLAPSELAAISRAGFLACLAEHPALAVSLIRILAGRVRRLTENVKNLALLDVYGRVARTLLELAQPDDEGQQRIDQRLTHQEIANMVGASREMVSRIMKDLTSGGYVTVGKDHMIIKERLPRRW